MVAMLEEAARQFDMYADLHRSKNTKEGDSKAIANEVMAKKCREAARY